MIEILGLSATVALFFSTVGFILAAIDLIRDDDPYFFRKMQSDAWCAYMTFSWFIAISLVMMVFLFP